MTKVIEVSNEFFLVSEAATEVFYNKSFSWKFRKIHRKLPVPGSLFAASGLQIY